MLKIKKGDKVQVLVGVDRGREGVVERIFPKKGTAFVPGLAVYKKHIKAQAAADGKGGIYELSRPIALNKLAVVDKKTGKPTRVKFEIKEDKKSRISVKSNENLDTSK